MWYSMRNWIEAGFKDTERGGWQWHQTKRQHPERAARLWVAIAVATSWVVSVGGQAEATKTCSGLEALPERHIARRTAMKRSQPRLSSRFGQGIWLILVALLQQRIVPSAVSGGTVAQRTASARNPRAKAKRRRRRVTGRKNVARGASGFRGGFMKNLPVKVPPPPLLLKALYPPASFSGPTGAIYSPLHPASYPEFSRWQGLNPHRH